MMTRNYYCLVAGLPDLMMEDRKVAYTSLSLREVLREELHPQDYRLVCLYFLRFDHQNILTKLYGLDRPFDQRGIYEESLIDELTDKKAFELYEGGALMPYLNDYLEEYYDMEDKPDLVVAERGLSTAYFTMLYAEPNTLVNAYARHEMNLRNLFLALNGRKHRMEVYHELIGEGEIVEALRKSRARDFGLGAEFDNLEALLQIYEHPDILEREMKLDTLRWQFIDEATFFNYFSIEKILGFVLKLSIVERWFELDEEKGRELFKRLLNDLETGYEFPEEFKISHGKKK